MARDGQGSRTWLAKANFLKKHLTAGLFEWRRGQSVSADLSTNRKTITSFGLVAIWYADARTTTLVCICFKVYDRCWHRSECIQSIYRRLHLLVVWKVYQSFQIVLQQVVVGRSDYILHRIKHIDTPRFFRIIFHRALSLCRVSTACFFISNF